MMIKSHSRDPIMIPCKDRNKKPALSSQLPYLTQSYYNASRQLLLVLQTVIMLFLSTGYCCLGYRKEAMVPDQVDSLCPA